MTTTTGISATQEKALVQDLKNIKARRDVNRRNFMAGLGLVGAAAGASMLGGCTDSGIGSAVAAGPTQNDVLNFALNLEYLEGTFYSYVTTGADLPATSTAGSGPITGAPGKLTIVGTGAGLANDTLAEIAFDEASHVADLRSALGSAAVARPALNLAAMGAVTLTNVVALARAFEDVGVSAYSGSATLLTGTNLTYAAQILAVEGFHAGVLRYMYLQFGMSGATKLDAQDVLPFDPGPTLVGSGPTAAGGIFATAGAGNSTPSVLPGFAYTRTTSQVLAIVYGGAQPAGTTKGGFFPNGMNGNITTV